MIVSRMAMTPSLNASRRPLFIAPNVPLPTRAARTARSPGATPRRGAGASRPAGSGDRCYTPSVRRFWNRFGIAMMILGLAHYYVWLRLVSAAHLPPRWHVLATIAVVVLAPSLP